MFVDPSCPFAALYLRRDLCRPLADDLASGNILTKATTFQILIDDFVPPH